MAQNQVSIVVSGRSYTISADADRDTLVAAVERVDESITRYRKMPMSDELRAATLSSVIFAYDLIEHELKNSVLSKEIDESRSEARRLQSDFNELLEKQNEVLGESGKLRDKADLFETERDELFRLKTDLTEEIRKIREEFEGASIEKQSEIEALTRECRQLQESLSEKTADRDTLFLKLEIAERDYPAVIRDLKDELEFQQLAFEEERENSTMQFSQELNEAKIQSDILHKEILVSHENAIQLIADERDAVVASRDELREDIRLIEQDREEIRAREIELVSNSAELELRVTELEHFLATLQEERELLQLERDELLSSLTSVTSERDGLRNSIALLENERDEIAQFHEELSAEASAEIQKFRDERKNAEAALMKMLGKISGAGIFLS